MTAKEVLEILKESNLWAPLTEGEKQEVINQVFRIYKGEGSGIKKAIIREE